MFNENLGKIRRLIDLTYRTKSFWFFVSVVFFIGFLGANIHLVYVSVSSQPECVVHEKTLSEINGMYRAAKSSC